MVPRIAIRFLAETITVPTAALSSRPQTPEARAASHRPTPVGPASAHPVPAATTEAQEDSVPTPTAPLPYLRVAPVPIEAAVPVRVLLPRALREAEVLVQRSTVLVQKAPVYPAAAMLAHPLPDQALHKVAAVAPNYKGQP